jgi:hypothetical protein
MSKFDKSSPPENLPRNEWWCLATKAYLYFGLKPWELLRELGYSNGKDISDPEREWQNIKAIMRNV